MNERQRRAKLSHDVGKYIARAAVNWPSSGAAPDVLHRMLIKDLYGSDSMASASVRFEELASGLKDNVITSTRAHLQEIDALEHGVRAEDEVSIRRAVALALKIQSELRTWEHAAETSADDERGMT